MIARAVRKVTAAGGIRRPQQGQNADGECRVGCHGNAPAVRIVAAGIERKIDQGGRQHPPEGRSDNRYGALYGFQFADQQFAFDLQAEQKEKQRHQAFIDPVAQRHRE